MNKDKKPLVINPFVLVFCVIVICGLFTFIITPGTLEAGVYTALPRNVVNFNNIFKIFRAVPYGLKDTANIVILNLVVGGALGIWKKSGAIDNGINGMVKRFGAGSANLLLIVLIVVFSILGGFLGWIEVLIPFAPLVIAVVLALGFDSLTAVAVVILGCMAGFTAGPMNLYTVAICNQSIISMGLVPEDYNVFAGMGLRMVIWILMTVLVIAYVLRYANMVKKDPSKSYVADIDTSDLKLDTASVGDAKLTGKQIIVLLTVVAAIAMTVIGMQWGFNGVKWSIDDVSAVFFASAVISGLVCSMNGADIATTFMDGAKGSIGGAFIVGVARGVYWILNSQQVLGTIVYVLTNLLRGTSPMVAAIGIIVIVSFINGLIPSGSGKAALLAPIIVPIGMELGLLPTTTVLAYQFGDGITNMFWFSYGTLMIFLNYGKVPLQKWYKFFVPLMIVFFIIAFVGVGVSIGMG